MRFRTHWYASPPICYFTSSFHGRSSSIGGLWCVISGIVVLQATSRDAWKSAVLRVLGTLIGATIGGFYLHLLPFSPIGMAVSVGLTVLLCQALSVPDHGRLATITVALVMVIRAATPSCFPSNPGAALYRIGYRCWDSGVGGPALAQGRRGHVTRSHFIACVRPSPQELAPVRKEPMPMASARTWRRISRSSAVVSTPSR